MKKILLIFIFSAFISPAENPQIVSFRSSQQEIYLPDHTDKHFLFVPAGFETARIYYNTGEVREMQLQYNILQNLIQYTDSRGISVLEPDNRMDSIVFADHAFIHDPKEGFLELLNGEAIALLLRRRISLHFEPVRRGAYGAESPSASIRTYYPRRDGTATLERANPFRYQMTIKNHLEAELEISMRKSETFFIHTGTELVDASRQRHILRAFADHRAEIRRFMRLNEIDLDRKEDLRKLAGFLSSFR